MIPIYAKLKKTMGHSLQNRDPYRPHGILKYNFPEIAFSVLF